MKDLFFAVLLIFASNTLCLCQKNTGAWRFFVQYSVEESDKRLFELNSSMQDILLMKNTGKWGSSQMDIGISYRLSNPWRISPSLGLTYSKGIHTFNRPFDYCSLSNKTPCPLIFLSYHTYKIDFISVPIMLEFRVFDFLQLTLNAKNQFDFNKKMLPAKISKLDFGYYSTELHGGLSFEYRNIVLGFEYRMYQIKKIDKIIFNYLLFDLTNPPDPRLAEVWEDYNPEKYTFTLGYCFDWKKKKKEK